MTEHPNPVRRPRIDVIHGDSRAVLAKLADGCIDACVCDPPYALVSIGKRFGAAGAAPAQSKGASGVYARASAGFMGQRWDTGETAFDPAFWAEVLRVLKPGGHVVAASGTRTYHRLACAVEDAGFEIRDMVSWLYGSGFPKSHDVSKGIAKRRVEDVDPVRVVCRFIRAAMDDLGLKSKDLTYVFNDCNPRLIDHWAARDSDSQPALPTATQWQGLVSALMLDGREGFAFIAREVARLNARKGSAGEQWTGADVVGFYDGEPGGFGDLRFSYRDKAMRALEGDAAKWQGWGTALKPACERWVLARKPLDGTVAANVLQHGAGALNIDGCRVGGEDTTRRNRAEMGYHGGNLAGDYRTGSDAGRWPANVVHDGSDEVLRAFLQPGDQAGAEGSGEGGNSGSAARFFYSAKADAGDRLGSDHPTVKPVDLMAWLIRLVTPPGGRVLDPFAGSGSTGIAALGQGFDAVLIEREARYVETIRRRLAWARGEGQLTEIEMARLDTPAKRLAAAGYDTPLFGEVDA